MSEIKRIIQFTGKLGTGGIESSVMNLYRNFNKEQYQFDFVVREDDKCFYEKEIYALGGKIINIHNFQVGLWRIVKQMRDFYILLRNDNYRIVHFHLSEVGRGFYYVVLAKLMNKSVVVYVHSNKPYTSIWMRLLNIIGRYVICFSTDQRFACSDKAGEYAFGIQKYKIFHNCIDFDKYTFNVLFRSQVRERLGINGQIVLGHVGRFEKEKNHSFLLDILYELNKTEEGRYLLLLLGEGSQKEIIERKAEEKGIKKYVFFIGATSKVNEYLSAMDVFLLPSLFEGFPMCVIEAQVSGLPMIVSENVSKEIDLSGRTEFLPIDDVELWCEVVKKQMKNKRSKAVITEQLQYYDIKKESCRLEELYDKLWD